MVINLIISDKSDHKPVNGDKSDNDKSDNN